jgi:hypothetical protein
METKEGSFLLNGVDITGTKPLDREGSGTYGYNSGLITPIVQGDGYIIKCGINQDTQEFEPQRIKYTENNGILGYHSEEITPINFKSLPQLIPGFSFVKGQCDPCVAFHNPQKYTCPFNLEVKNQPKEISPVWQYLWGLNNDPLKTEAKLVEQI